MKTYNWLFAMALGAALTGAGVFQAGAAQEAGHRKDDHDGAAEARTVHLTEAQLGRLDIRTDKVPAGSAEAVVKAPATVRFNANAVSRIGPLLQAKVVDLTSDLGDRVAVGDTVAVLESVALGKAKARYLRAAARLRTERAAYRREKQLAEQQISSEASLLEAEAAFRQAQAGYDALREELRLYGLTKEQIDGIQAGTKAPLSRYRLTTPTAGIVQSRDLVAGQTLGPKDTPIHVVDTSRVWVMIDAYEQDLPNLKTGLRVEFSPQALGSRHFTGKVDWISRELDAETRTVTVRAVVDNGSGLLRAGMFGNAVIYTDSASDAAMVPVDAVQTIDGEPVVFVPGEEPGAFLAVSVETGAEQAGRMEVLAGVQPGDTVVTYGAFDLKSALTARGRSASHGH